MSNKNRSKELEDKGKLDTIGENEGTEMKILNKKDD